VYISLVRSNDKSEIGFLRDYRRMNVAMTRARMKLVMIGDSATLGNDKFFAELLEYVESIAGYRSAWEFSY
jgi:superfamily I DNA and/or RNA helicase